MVQNDLFKEDHAEYQPVNPSRFTPLEMVQEGRKGGAKVEIKPVSKVEAALRRTLTKENLSDLWYSLRPVRSFLMWSALILTVAGLACYALYLIGLAIVEAIGEGLSELRDSGALRYVIIGAVVLLVLLILYYIIDNTKRSVPFEGWHTDNKGPKTSKNGPGGPTYIINQKVEVMDGKIVYKD